MSRPEVDDIMAVLREIRNRFRSSGSEADIRRVRIEAIQAIAQIELDSGRFANIVSAKNSIGDACVRRLGYTEFADFDRHLDDWLRGRSAALSTAVIATAKTKTEDQRRMIAEELVLPYHHELVEPQARDLESPPRERVETTTSRIIRNTRHSNRVKMIHNYECQLCGYTLFLADGSRYAEGHHLQPLGAPYNGPDEMANIICLCPNHHAACDLGAIELLRNNVRIVEGHAVGQRYIDYHNSRIYRGSDHV